MADGDQYCFMRDCFSPVFKSGLCKAHLSEMRALKERSLRGVPTPEMARQPRSVNNRDQVYVIECGEFVKVGYSTNVDERINSIQTSSPYEIKLIGTIKGGRGMEAKLHRALQDERVRGEWFRRQGIVEDLIELMISENLEGILRLAEDQSHYFLNADGTPRRKRGRPRKGTKN